LPALRLDAEGDSRALALSAESANDAMNIQGAQAFIKGSWQSREQVPATNVWRSRAGSGPSGSPLSLRQDNPSYPGAWRRSGTAWSKRGLCLRGSEATRAPTAWDELGNWRFGGLSHFRALGHVPHPCLGNQQECFVNPCAQIWRFPAAQAACRPLRIRL